MLTLLGGIRRRRVSVADYRIIMVRRLRLRYSRVYCAGPRKETFRHRTILHYIRKRPHTGARRIFVVLGSSNNRRRDPHNLTSLLLFPLIELNDTRGKINIMSSSTTNTAPFSFLHWGSTMITQHPRTLFLGGVLTYVAVGYLTLDGVRRKAWFRPVTLTLSSVFTVIGFGVSLVDDIHDAVADGRTAVWQQAVEALRLFLKESGLDDEFDQTLSSSHLVPALMVLVDLQNKVQRQRRVALRQTSGAGGETPVDPTDLTLGQHYMRYATAVYGAEMMASTQLAVYDTTLTYPNSTTHEWIAQHVHLEAPTAESSLTLATTTTTPRAPSSSTNNPPKYEIWCDYTRDPTDQERNHAQHCMIVCDHVNEVVVVAIRGTFSLSGIITDIAGYCEPFCGGMAHAGMAQAARETWESVWEEILQDKVQTLPSEYAMVVSGHSLGAGVACLVTILMYHQRRHGKLPALKDRRIQCYAMAPPPVFCPLSAAPEAVANTVAYIHQYDCVPSLSVDGVRRLMACLDRIEDVLSRHPMMELAAQRWELGEHSPEMVAAYEQPEKAPLRELDKAPMVFIPARQLIWLEKKVDETSGEVTGYEAHALDPTFYADRILDLELPDCVADHLTPEYETAFAKLMGVGQFGGNDDDDDDNNNNSK